MIQSDFKDWTLEKIDESFGLRQVFNTTLLDELMNYNKEFSEFETQYIKNLQAHFNLWLLCYWQKLVFHGFEGERICHQ